MTSTVTPTEIVWRSYYRGNVPSYAPTGKKPSTKADPDKIVRLEVSLPEAQPCAVCGRPVTEGFETYAPAVEKVKKEGKPTKGMKYVGVISESYGDHHLLPYPASGITCPVCEAVFRQALSFPMAVVANMEKCIFVRGKDAIKANPASGITWGGLWSHIMSPPEPPFIIAVNRSMTVDGSKPTHFIPLATVNYSRDRFVVDLYEKALHIDRPLMDRFFIQTGLAARIVANRTVPKNQKVLFGLLEEFLFAASEELRYGNAGRDMGKLAGIAPEIAADPALIRECATAENIRVIRFLRLSMSAE